MGERDTHTERGGRERERERGEGLQPAAQCSPPQILHLNGYDTEPYLGGQK
jgi:hypothetical protein